jgi:hypothetical protein
MEHPSVPYPEGKLVALLANIVLLFLAEEAFWEQAPKFNLL